MRARTAFWTKIGAGWEHEDRKGLNILRTAMPQNGRLVIREQKAQDAEAGPFNNRKIWK
ncbi:hypothetical protein [Bradyrhizobium sp. CCGUVB23]|uniref:hypothetical protein n=1 Tax=Bradyrhizobium sp. CCGUVB23 TaxID=2949630 RepID=UPI0020B42460|nr:hypothetical protein [Bradyrhizobium sp. CCGUVB23]MCP3468214.1 hypothetical protein [Bradyrhizobium sp. CCGUVB23]